MYYIELMFLHTMRSAGHVMRSGAFEVCNNVTILCILRWAWCGSNKKRAMTCYVELLFLYPVRSVGHVVRSSVSGVQNYDTLFFMLGWAWCRSHKKRDGTWCGSNKKRAMTCYVKLLFCN
jgi:hypothetical protein